MNDDSDRLRIALVAASPMVRAGLRAGLGAGLAPPAGFEIVLESAGWMASRAAGHGGAQVAIVDVGNDAEVPSPAGGLTEGPAVLLLVGDAARGSVGDWLAQGASVLPRQASLAQIAAAARAAAAGLVTSETALVAAWLRSVPPAYPGTTRRSLTDPLEPLTPREHEVLQRMTQGLGNREIAEALAISAHTAKFHVAQIIAKLDASSRAHAVAKALRAGLIEI